ncbi:MAG: M50 family metallopeptidase [Calditrichaceae bacterium]
MDRDFIPILEKNLVITKMDAKSYIVSHNENITIKISAFGKYILDLMDGTLSLNDIFVKIKQEYIKFEYENLVLFVNRIIECNLIANVAYAQKKSIWKRVSYIEIWSFSSDKYYKTFAQICGGKLVKIITITSFIIINFSLFHFVIWGLKISPSVVDADIFQKSLPLFYPFFIVFVFFKTFFHESAHAITCRYFGQKVRGIGVGLYLLHPVFFTDTTNIWHETNKFKRILVSLAGPMSDLSFISLVYLINSFLITDLKYYNMILLVLFYSCIKTILNINPFLKLDGYYILTDLIEIPNLQKNSFKCLFDIFLRNDVNITRKKKFLYLFFGVFSSLVTFIFITGFLFYILCYFFDITFLFYNNN